MVSQSNADDKWGTGWLTSDRKRFEWTNRDMCDLYLIRAPFIMNLTANSLLCLWWNQSFPKRILYTVADQDNPPAPRLHMSELPAWAMNELTRIQPCQRWLIHLSSSSTTIWFKCTPTYEFIKYIQDWNAENMIFPIWSWFSFECRTSVLASSLYGLRRHYLMFKQYIFPSNTNIMHVLLSIHIMIIHTNLMFLLTVLTYCKYWEDALSGCNCSAFHM